MNRWNTCPACEGRGIVGKLVRCKTKYVLVDRVRVKVATKMVDQECPTCSGTGRVNEFDRQRLSGR